MLRLIRSFTPAVRVSLIVGLLQLVVAGGTHRVLAAPTAGAFVVNTTSDAYAPDTVLSLREALAVANGTLTGAFTVAEQTQLGGCTFDGGGNITGGCGAGIADTITFDAGLGFQPTLTLFCCSLPAINDTAPTTINGFSPNVRPILDAAFIFTGTDVLTISSDANLIDSIEVINSPRDGIRITSKGNTVQFVYVRGSGRNGITIDGGSFNIINGFFGTLDSFTASCVSGAANAQHGVALLNGAYFNSVQSSNIGCSGGAGVEVNGTGTDNNRIRGNTIGTNSTGSGVIMNTTAVLIESGAQFNQVITNTIANSAQDGVWLTGINTRDNAVYGNTIRNNGLSGVEISGGALFNAVGADAVSPSIVSGNVIISNTLEGVYISGNTTANNAVYANRIGVNAAGTAANGNGNHGVSVINQAHDNLIGASDATGNTIAANGGNGININNAYNNFVAGNRIGTNALGTASLPNAVNGIALVNGAHNNTLGGPSVAQRNLIGGNAQHGVLLDGSTTATNTVTFNDIGYNTLNTALLPNGFDGIALSNGTFNNTLGGIGAKNFIYINTHNGIGLSSGAHGNHINYNWIYGNGRYGVLFDGGSTAGNVISLTQITSNNYDGIGEKNAAGGNSWSETSIYSNGGLGIDKNIASDVVNTPDPPNLVITSVNLVTGLVQGKANGSIGFLLTKVELYRILLDPSGYGEGWQFVGRAATNPAGDWALTDLAPASGCYTAYTTDENTLSGTRVSTEFSRSNCSLFLPIIHR